MRWVWVCATGEADGRRDAAVGCCGCYTAQENPFALAKKSASRPNSGRKK